MLVRPGGFFSRGRRRTVSAPPTNPEASASGGVEIPMVTFSGAATFTPPVSASAQPFSSLSPWNSVLASNATYAPVTGFADLDVGIQSWAEAADGFSIAVPAATNSDPLVNVVYLDSWVNVNNGTWARSGNDSTKEADILAASANSFPADMNTYSTTQASADGSLQVKPASGSYVPLVNPPTVPFQIRCPASAVPSFGSDGHMVVIQPDGRVFEAYSAIKLSNGTIACTRYMMISQTGMGDGATNGLTASMVPVFAGVMRKAEADKASGITIDHAIKIAIPGNLLSTATPAYPALAFDRSALSNTPAYNGTGAVPMGTRLAIPWSVNLAGHTFDSNLGAAIARAAQRHGFIITDRGGSGLTLFGEKDPTDGQLTAWHFGVSTDLNWIMDNIQRVLTGDPNVAPVDVSTFSTKAGDGTTSLDTTNGTMSIAFGTTATSLRSSAIAVTVGKRYRVIWSLSGSSGGQAGFGTSVGGPQYRPTTGGALGANTFEFVAETTALHITFQRASAGTTVFGPISLLEIPAAAFSDLSPQPITPAFWTTVNAGATVDGTTGAVTITASGTQVLVRGSFTSIVGKLYRLRFTVGTSNAFVLIGTSAGGSQIKASSSSNGVGSWVYEFAATSTATHIQVHRSAAGTTVVSDIAIQEVTP